MELMNTESICLSLIALIAVSPAYADDGYVGIGLGQSEINQGLFGEYGNAFKVFGGWRMHPHLAIEAAYLNFGNPSQNLFGIETQYEASAVAAWAKGLWPVSKNIDLFGKAGLAHWKVDETTTVFGFPPSKSTTNGTNFAWGLGVIFNHWEKVSMQLEYEDINSDLDTITLWSISALYKF